MYHSLHCIPNYRYNFFYLILFILKTIIENSNQAMNSEVFISKHYPNFHSIMKVGEGGVADVLSCTSYDKTLFSDDDTEQEKSFVVKVSRDKDDIKFLHFEADTLEILSRRKKPLNRSIVPRPFFIDEREGLEILGMEELGKSLFILFCNDCSCKFSVKTVLMILDQCLQLLQHAHQNNVYHLDIKDQNILVGTGTNNNRLYLVDFGLSLYFDKEDQTKFASSSHVPFYSISYGLEGTIVQQKKKLYRDKDLMDLLKMALFFLDSQKFMFSDYDIGECPVLLTKDVESRLNNLLSSYLPELWEIFDYFVNAAPTVNLNYDNMRKMLKRAANRLNISYDWNFDWMEEEPSRSRENSN